MRHGGVGMPETGSDTVHIAGAAFQKNKVITEDVLRYLDEINTPCRVNAFELAPELEESFSLTRHEANRYILLWLRLFAERYLNKKQSGVPGQVGCSKKVSVPKSRVFGALANGSVERFRIQFDTQLPILYLCRDNFITYV